MFSAVSVAAATGSSFQVCQPSPPTAASPSSQPAIDPAPTAAVWCRSWMNCAACASDTPGTYARYETGLNVTAIEPTKSPAPIHDCFAVWPRAVVGSKSTPTIEVTPMIPFLAKFPIPCQNDSSQLRFSATGLPHGIGSGEFMICSAVTAVYPVSTAPICSTLIPFAQFVAAVETRSISPAYRPSNSSFRAVAGPCSRQDTCSVSYEIGLFPECRRRRLTAWPLRRPRAPLAGRPP
ncbi:hypothetical protein CFK38_05815 [Brachybacterium vulturis]|uniref:Uncharacterized protein n=1 Tax=Brachybacterium vulturis TaxID=2017484 RepID=A0A291GKQ8_9MICO|nr:hypothetical protein CFK38_05815 [Brachybacterium vulturis]